MSSVHNHIKDIPRDEQEDVNSILKVDKAIYWVLILALVTIPNFIMGSITQFVSPEIGLTSFYQNGTKGDFYSKYKFYLLIIITVISLLLFLYKTYILNDAFSMRYIEWTIVGFIIVVSLATLFSPYKSIAIFGMFNRSDGAISYICYFILFLIALNIRYLYSIKIAIYAMYAFVLVNAVFSGMAFFFTQALEYSFFQSLFSIFLPEGANISSGSTLPGTLNQGNYISGSFGVMAVFFLAASLFEKKITPAISHLIMALLSVAIMFTGLSVSGFLTILAFLPVIAILIYKASNKIKFATLFGAFIVGFAGILLVFADHNPRVWGQSMGFFTSENPFRNAQAMDIDLDNKIHADARTETLKLPELPQSDLSFGTGRAYIWESSIEAVLDRPLIGYGLDTLPFAFNQEDIEKREGLIKYSTIVDKPHNIFVGILVGTGFLGFSVYLTFIVVSALPMLKYVFSKITTNPVPMAIFLGWFAFLFQGLANDSIVGTTAHVFILTGIGLGWLRSNKNLNSQE